MADDSCGFVVSPVEDRLALLVSLIRRYWDSQQRLWSKKILLVLCHDNSVKFHAELFRWFSMDVMTLLGPDIRSVAGRVAYKRFQECEAAVLAVSSNNINKLKRLQVESVIIYEPPHDTQVVESLLSSCQDLLLFLRPSEKPFLSRLAALHPDLPPFEERSVPWSNIPRLPKAKMQHLYNTQYSMNFQSKAAYKCYMRTLRDHPMKDCFNLDGVLIREVAAGYCFEVIPTFKLVNEKSRYQMENERKEEKRNGPHPEPIVTIKTIYKVVRQKKEILEEKRKNAPPTFYDETDEPGIIQLVGNLQKSKKTIKNKIARERRMSMREKEMSVKSLKKMLKKLPTARRSAKRLSRGRKRGRKI